jgi:predicted ATPase
LLPCSRRTRNYPEFVAKSGHIEPDCRYTKLGYRIVRLPLASPAERADFVLAHSAEI